MVYTKLLVVFVFFSGLAATAHAQDARSATTSDRIQLTFNSEEAEAVLAILDKRAASAAITEADWKRVFESEPYVRLKKREAVMHRDFSDEDFKKFVLSPELAAKSRVLRQTLETWRHAALAASAGRVLAYLPEQARVKAKIFPVIKPITNSFVFETTSDAAIFLYLDPEESAAKFENTVAHELHHIGFSSIESLTEEKQKGLSPKVKAAVDWMGAFGEGFAMLAAAGGPGVDPHAASSPADRARWNHDMANFNQDLTALRTFFLDVVDQRLVEKDKIDAKAYTFFGVQGPWYTVGYKMAVLIENRFGRKKLIESMLDPRELLAAYNQAAEDINRSGGEKLALWTPELMRKIGAQPTDAAP
jgi:hypothetical protein